MFQGMYCWLGGLIGAPMVTNDRYLCFGHWLGRLRRENAEYEDFRPRGWVFIPSSNTWGCGFLGFCCFRSTERISNCAPPVMHRVKDRAKKLHRSSLEIETSGKLWIKKYRISRMYLLSDLSYQIWSVYLVQFGHGGERAIYLCSCLNAWLLGLSVVWW